MSKDSVLKKIKDFIVTQLSSDEQKALNEFKPYEVKMTDVKTADGSMTISFDGTLAVGTKVMDNTSGTPAPLADGEYTLADGTVITVMNGQVAEMETAQAAATEDPMDLQKLAPIVEKAVATQMSAIKLSSDNQVKELKLANEALTAQVLTLTSLVNKILETPIETVEKKQTPVVLSAKEKALEEYREAKRRFN